VQLHKPSDSFGQFCLAALEGIGIETGNVITDRSVDTGVTISLSNPTDRALVTFLGAISNTEAVDTTGAGDSFAAGFLHGYLEGCDLDTSLKYGNACGALSTRGIGGDGDSTFSG